MSRLVLSQITIKKERSISSTTWYYLLQPSNASAPDSTNYGNPPPIYSDTGYSGWSTTEPTYTVGDDRVLYTMVQTLYSDNTFSYSTPTISSSYEAAKDAYNEVVQAEQDILELQELGLANGYVWDNMTYVAPTSTIPVYPIGSYIASGTLVNGSRTITRSNSNTYGLNTWISTGGINLRYNAIDLMKLTTSNLEFYYPSTSSQGTKAISLGTNGAINSLVFYGFNNSNKTMELTNNALNFYNPADGSTLLSSLTSNGLILSKGGIVVGSYNSSASDANQNFVYLSSEDYGTGIQIGNSPSGKTDWRQIIGNKFGVDKAGNLYASNATISGKITATSLTIGSGATVSGLSTSNISGMNDYALQSSLDTEIAERKAVYAISTTGATTFAKTTESGTPAGFVLYNGATVTVKFNSANSTSTPTLNVNGTGAKTIKSYTGAALSAAEYTWPAGAAITFTYDGSYWRMQDGGALQAKADAAASASAASNSASAASTSASSASTSASNASSSASAASTSASTASTKATEASNSASTASSEASAASTSATNAANSASAASTSATNASNSADAAASSASDANDSADAAAGSASTASSKATAAADSATSASNSANSASSSATAASNSASSASSSATTATNQANAAAGSATAASNSATAASDSATAASGSATAASNSAIAASNSATAASNSATAAAEVMGGFTILWNYSAFVTSTAGDAFICGFDSATGTKSDANGWVKWNGTKRTITKQQVNPGTIVPYNIPIYIVCRLSSATSTTGINYMVWYNSGWKYAACPSPTTVGGSWTWTDNRDIILGSFVETGADEALTECELFNPPWTSKQITTNTTTPTSYIMDTDSNRGITVKPKDSSGNDFLQMNSTAIEFFRNSTTASAMRLTDNSFRLGLEASNHTTIDTNGLHIWTGTENTATNEVALFSSTARIGKTNSSRFLLNADSLQAYNSSNQLYFEVSDEELKTSLTEAKDVFTVGYGSAIANKTETRILNSTSGVLDLTAIPFNTNFNLTFTVFFVGYSVTLGQSTTFENTKLYPSGNLPWNSANTELWQQAAGYSGELLPSGSMNLSIGQPTPGEKQINYNITITGTGLTFDYATITAVWEESAAVKDQVFLTFGSREDGISKGLFSSAMGLKVAAIGDYSHAEGYHTIASGNYSHTGGFGTQAIGDYSYSSGYGTKATIDYQTVFGKYNLEDSEAMFIVGNGTDDNNRSNLMTIGNNFIRIGNNNEGSNNIQISPDGLTISHGVSSIFNVGEADSTELGYTTETFNQTITGSNSDVTVTIQLGIEQTPPVGSTITLNRNYDSINSGGDSSSGSSSSSGGSGSSGTGSSSGSGSGQARPGVYQIPYEHYTAGTSATTTHNGCVVVYDGAYTFTITVNSGYYFNLYNIKYANTSTAGGKLTLGSRINTPEPITIGGSTREDGFNSTTLGTGLQAYTPNQLVIGKYNKGDSTNMVSVKHAFIIGNGSINSTGEITESNALTIDWDGNIVIPNYSSYGAVGGNGYVNRLCYVTSANNCIFGYDGYDNQDGDSFLYGNNVYIRTAAGYIYPNTRIVMPNNVSIRAKTANGNNDYQLIFASDSNNIVVGSSSWNDCYIHRVYNSNTGTVSTVPNVRILDNSRLTRTTHANSSIKIKHDIKDIENKELDPHRLYGVEVKQFVYNDDVITDKNDCRYHKEIAGFIAEQLHECYPIAVDINEKGECEAWQAQYIIPPMLKLIQEQHEEIEQLKKEVAELKNR